MIYIIYGEDTYRSRRKLKEIVDEYRVRGGDVERFDAEERDAAELKDIANGQSLFSAKKLIVVEYAFSCRDFFTLKEIVTGIKNLKDVCVILWDQKLDEKKKKCLNEAEQYAEKIQEFRPLTGDQLKRWIREEAKRRGVLVTKDTAMHLESFGNDLWALSNELDKLALSESRGAGAPLRERTVFQLGDSFFTHKKNALQTLLHLFLQGHDALALFGYLTNHTRALSIVQSHVSRGKPVPASSGLHPYVVKKTTPLARRLPTEYVHKTLSAFLGEDHHIKTGISHPEESLIRMIIR